jgi:hypothetical protein
MKRVLAILVLTAGLLVAACGGSTGSAGTSLEPISTDSAPVESLPPDLMSPDDMLSPAAS